MKFMGSAVAVVFLLGVLSSAQNSRPVPAGMRHAQELKQQNERGFPPPDPSRRALSMAQLNTEASQLAELAASVPQSVQKAGKGMLEKDLLEKLKRIEKLSKHPRSKLDR